MIIIILPKLLYMYVVVHKNMPEKPTKCIWFNYISCDIKAFCKPLSASEYNVDNTFQHDVNIALLIWDCACYRHAKN